MDKSNGLTRLMMKMNKDIAPETTLTRKDINDLWDICFRDDDFKFDKV